MIKSKKQSVWRIEVKDFLKGFKNPGNKEHEIWVKLCSLSILNDKDVIEVTIDQISSFTNIDNREIEEIFGKYKYQGNVLKKNQF